jgi:hypothetical protein
MQTSASPEELNRRFRETFTQKCRAIMHTYRERVGTILKNADERKKTELLRKLKP